MNLSSKTALITGGASGIGFALAERFLRAGSRVLICGRREEKLREAKEKHPEFHTRVCDLARESDRLGLLDWTRREFPETDVLVNNAGIQERLDLTNAASQWPRAEKEIAVNLEAAVNLAMLFVAHLARQPEPAIINVTSGLAFAPRTAVPVYCATKAALHSFTLSLRHQLAATNIRVIEIAPPAVDTDLGGPGLHTFGIPIDELVDAVMPRLQAGELEIAYGFAEQSSRASRAELDAIFQRLNS